MAYCVWLRTLILALSGTTGTEQTVANKKFSQARRGRAGATGLSDFEGQGCGHTILKARILLKPDQGEAGEGWSDAAICKTLDTNATMVEACAPSSWSTVSMRCSHARTRDAADCADFRW